MKMRVSVIAGISAAWQAYRNAGPGSPRADRQPIGKPVNLIK